MSTRDTFKAIGKLMTTADWKYQISLALPENTPDQVLSDIYDIVESLLLHRTSEREEIARSIERMYGPHDKRFNTAIEIADVIRKGGTSGT